MSLSTKRATRWTAPYKNQGVAIATSRRVGDGNLPPSATGEVTVRPNWPLVALAFAGLTGAIVWLGNLFGGSAGTSQGGPR